MHTRTQSYFSTAHPRKKSPMPPKQHYRGVMHDKIQLNLHHELHIARAKQKHSASTMAEWQNYLASLEVETARHASCRDAEMIRQRNAGKFSCAFRMRGKRQQYNQIYMRVNQKFSLFSASAGLVL